MSDMKPIRTVRHTGWLLPPLRVLPWLIAGCAATVVTNQVPPSEGTTWAFVRVLTVLADRPGRLYDPALQLMEVRHRASGNRYRVEVGADDKFLVFPLPSGEYEVTRVQISEGPFLSMAEPSMVFHIEPEGVTYLGRWRLAVQSPRYGRNVLVSVLQPDEGQTEDWQALTEEYPERTATPVMVAGVTPTALETRLYEVMPYPRYPPYFRRHLW